MVNIKVFDLRKNCLIKDENYKDKKPIGLWTTFSEDCSVINKRDFSILVYSDQQVDTVFNNVLKDGNVENYEKAQYGDDEKAIFNYIGTKIRYPHEAKVAGLSGIVYLQIIIKADGTVEMVSVMRGAHPFLDYEAWELVASMPKWNPAKKDGQPIDSFYNLPIRFLLI